MPSYFYIFWYAIVAVLIAASITPHLPMRYRISPERIPWPFHQRLRRSIRPFAVGLLIGSIGQVIILGILFGIGAVWIGWDRSVAKFMTDWPYLLYLPLQTSWILAIRELDDCAAESETLADLTFRRLEALEVAADRAGLLESEE